MSKHEGVRYREHATRRHGRNADRYIVIRYRVNGRRIDEAIGWASQGASLDRAAEILAALRQNHRTGVGPQTMAEMRALAQAERDAQASAVVRTDIPSTIGELYAAYIAQAERTKKSWRNDREIYASRLASIADLRLEAITPERISAHRDELSARYAPASVRHALGLLRRMVRWAAAHYGRDWSRDVPDNVVPMLAIRVAATDPGALLFRSPVTGGRVHSISPRFRACVDALGLNAGIEDQRFAVTFHTLRHTYVSWLVMAGVDLRTVQEMARHRSFDMTLRYAHLAPRARRAAANLLAGFVDS